MPTVEFLHSFSNRIQCQSQQRLLLELCPLAPVPTPWAGSWLHVDWCARSHEGAGLWQWQWGDLSLLQLIRKVILCFQYETFHSKIQSQDFLDSVFTHFKHDFIWYWIEFSLYKVSLQNYVNTIIIFSCQEKRGKVKKKTLNLEKKHY